MNQYQLRLEEIQAHLKQGGYVMTVTYLKAIQYGPKHLDWFSATDNGLYVRQGKSRVCLNFTNIRFSVL